MRIKEGFVLRTICGQSVVSGEGTANVNFSKLVSLNDSAAYLYKAVEGKDFTPETLADLLLKEYEEDDSARRDPLAEALATAEAIGVTVATSSSLRRSAALRGPTPGRYWMSVSIALLIMQK